MRVIAGKARRLALKTVPGMETRPTTDRIKETLFNMIQDELYGIRFLDLFSGSGAIGIEALSRGAKKAILVDSSKSSLAVINRNLETTGLSENAEVKSSDSISYLKGCDEKFDIAFLDPPYRKGLLEKALDILPIFMNRTGKIICEHPRDEELPNQIGEFVIKKQYRYGKIMLTAYIHESML